MFYRLVHFLLVLLYNIARYHCSYACSLTVSWLKRLFFQSASNTRLSIWTLFIQIQGKHAMPIRLWRYIIVERIVLNTCPREMFWLLGCTGLSLSSTTPRRVKFMVRSCLWLCDINVEKSNGYTLYISFELFKIFFFTPT